MQILIKENILKNIILLGLFAFLASPIRNYLLNSNLVADVALAGDVLVAVSVIAVIACFGNFAFTYEKGRIESKYHRLLGHITTGLLMFVVGISLIFTSVLVSIIMGYFLVIDLILIALYAACVGYDFWDAFRRFQN